MSSPNIVLICTDQQRSDSLACAGNPVARTPNIDRIAANGTRFARHHTPMQICSPSRATMFTGLYPRHHGLVTNGRVLDTGLTTVTDALSAAGYATHSVGKQHLQPILAPVELELPDSRAFWSTETAGHWTGPYYGFQTLDLLIGESDTAMIAGHYARWLEQEYPDSRDLLKVRHAPEPPPEDLDEIWRSAMPAELHYNTWISDRAVQFIENSGDPFFLFVSYPDPHHPFAPPREFADRWDHRDMPLPRMDPDEFAQLPEYYGKLFPRGQGFRKLYWSASDHEAGSMITTESISDVSMQKAIAHTYAMIEMIDEGVGAILDALDRRGLSGETLVLFTSDHGELLGSHGLLHKGPPSYRQLTEVSLLAMGPGVRAGGVIDSNTSHVDLAPTLLEVTGTDWTGHELDGLSLLTLLGGSNDAVREYEFGEYHPTVRPDVYNQTVRTDRWRLSVYPERPDWGELFDHSRDPWEHRNLYHQPDHSRVRSELEELIAREFPPAPDAGSEMLCKW